MSDELYRAEIEISGGSLLTRYDFSPSVSEPSLIKLLTDARREGNLVFVLGAGVSYPSGIVGWGDLIHLAGQRCIEGTALPSLILDKLTLAQIPLTAQVRFFENVLGVREAFRSHLTASLYGNLNTDLSSNALLTALAEISLGLDGGRPVTNVITYNVDNLYELRLRELISNNGLPFGVHSIYSHQLYENSNRISQINVYHPHGFIPYNEEFGKYLSYPIVFSEADYHRHYADLMYWANRVQLEAFERSVCLFVGLSFKDPNLRRILDFSKRGRSVRKSHVATCQIKLSPIGDPLPHLREFIIDKDLASFDVNPLWVSSFHDLPTALKNIK